MDQQESKQGKRRLCWIKTMAFPILSLKSKKKDNPKTSEIYAMNRTQARSYSIPNSKIA